MRMMRRDRVWSWALFEGGFIGGVALVVVACLGCDPRWPAPNDGAAYGDAVVMEGEDGGEALSYLPSPPCRPAGTGELVINEVVSRPGGVDVDHDGASNGHDEVVEVVSRADEAIHLGGTSLWWKGERRGGIVQSACLPPRTAAVIVAPDGGNLKLPSGAVAVLLDRTLRLTDSGGKLEMRSVAGTTLDAVSVPGAVTPSAPAVWSRTRDADWNALLRSHNEVSGATRPSSIGRCANAERFPCCVDWLDAYEEKGRLSE